MKLLKYEKFKGLHIVCKKCNKQIESNQSEYNGCKHPIEKQKYKAVIRKNGVRKTRDLKSLEYDEAVKELIEFKHELSNPIEFKNPIAIDKIKKENTKFDSLLDCIMIYGDYLENVDVPFFEQRPRSKEYIRDTLGYLLKFKNYIDSIGINSDSITIYQIDRYMVGNYFEQLYKKSKSVSTYNHHIRSLKSFFKFLIEKKGFELINPMEHAKLKNVELNTISVDDSDFKKIIKMIENTPEKDSIKTYKNGVKKKMYRQYLKDAIELIAYTGMRIEEAISIKYSDIITDKNGKLHYVKGIDLKFQKAHNYDNSQPIKFVPIPITYELEQLLIRLNYKKNIGLDKYLIEPDSTSKRETIATQLTHSFGFYRDKADVKSRIGLKHLRKTFLTKVQEKTGMVSSMGYQKTESVIQKNYIDTKKITESVNKKRIRLYN